MPQPTPIPVRRAICQQWQQGRPTAEIAASLKMSVRTVRHLIQRVRQQGEDGIGTSYCPKPRSLSAEHEKLREVAEHLRGEHASWGSILIQVQLAKQDGKDKAPSARTIRRWLAASGLGPSPRGGRPEAESSRADQPHEVWQMDASEEIKLKSGRRVCWLRIVDEHSGAVLMTRVFSPRTVESCGR